MTERKPHRNICSLCHEVERVGFGVPNEVWALAVYPSQANDIICLTCFTRLADERGVEWGEKIQFRPMSRVRHDQLVSGDAGTREPTPWRDDPKMKAARQSVVDAAVHDFKFRGSTGFVPLSAMALDALCDAVRLSVSGASPK